MTLDQLYQLQSLAKQARQDFLKELEFSGTYASLEKITGLSTQQLFRFVNDQKGQPKFKTLLTAYIRLKEHRGACSK